MTKSKYELKTEAYTSLLNRIQVNNVSLSDLDKMTFQEFNKAINSNAKTNGLYKRALALARNKPIQKDVNTLVKKKKIQFLVKPIIEKEYIPKKLTKKQLKTIKSKPKRLRYITSKDFYERLIFPYIITNKCKGITNAWNLREISERKLIGVQEVHIVLNFKLYTIYTNKYGKSYAKCIQKDGWITFKSGRTREKSICELLDDCLVKKAKWIWLMEQSNIRVSELKNYTIIYRKGI